jgi:hypothetical protein
MNKERTADGNHTREVAIHGRRVSGWHGAAAVTSIDAMPHRPIVVSYPQIQEVGSWSRMLPERMIFRASHLNVELVDGHLYTADFSGRFRFHLERLGQQWSVGCAIAVGESVEFAQALARGPILALVAALDGDLVLHANAVIGNGIGVACIGPAGRGKTFLSALLVASGKASLFADDSVVIDRLIDRGPVGMHSGLLELRLRDGGALEDALVLGGGAARETSEGRRAVRVANESAVLHHRLGLLVVPAIGPAGGPPRIRALEGDEKLRAALRSTRLPGWLDRTLAEQEFIGLTELMSCTPMVEMELPRIDLTMARVADVTLLGLQAWELLNRYDGLVP